MTSGIPDVPGRDVVQPLSAELAALVRQELQRVQREFLGQARGSRPGLRMVAGAVMLASMAAGSATSLVIRLLERRPGAAPATTAAVFGAASAALGAAGRARLRQAWSPVPDSVNSVELSPEAEPKGVPQGAAAPAERIVGFVEKVTGQAGNEER